MRKVKDFNRILMPLSLLSTRDYTILESLILYLKDSRKLNYHQIGIVINRDERNVRTLYLIAKEKQLTSREERIVTPVLIPVSIFSVKKISALEAIAVYLRDRFSLRFSQIAKLLDRDQRTIWTVYHRAKQKAS